MRISLNGWTLFSRVEQLHIAGHCTPNVTRALRPASAQMAAEVTPALRELILDWIRCEVTPPLHSDGEW